MLGSKVNPGHCSHGSLVMSLILSHNNYYHTISDICFHTLRDVHPGYQSTVTDKLKNSVSSAVNEASFEA